MHDSYEHVYLSPHLDDAVLSCGGLIHQQARAGQRPLVITLFAGQPPRDVPLSEYAQSLHRRWGNPDGIVQARWAEDQSALALLGADYLRLGYPDCIYRGRRNPGLSEPSGPHQGGGARPTATRPDKVAPVQEVGWFYPSRQAILGPVHPTEQNLPAELATVLSEFIPRGEEVTLYAPLAVGNHVDHQLTFAAACILEGQGWPVQFYEDYPYAEAKGALSAALGASGVHRWQAVTKALDEVELDAKTEAIACYQSQLGDLFGDGQSMRDRVRDFVSLVGGERLWRVD